MRPEDPLFIYEIEGRFQIPPEGLGRDFIAHWKEGESHFLFFSREQEERIKDILKGQPDALWIRSHTLIYRDWQGGESFDGVSIGKFLFLPPWIPVPQKSEGLPLRLDSGVVFGSGSHPTTRDSLLALQWVYEQDRPRKVLDLGCGTGILSLAACALGAEEVLAVDVNPACVRTAEKNARLNEMENKIRVREGQAEDFVQEPADLVLANLHFAVIRELIGRRAFWARKWLILSGLLRSEYREIRSRLQTMGFVVFEEWDADFTWFTLAGGVRDSKDSEKG
jgi:ribosomal protein L11 methyltransferase